MKEADRQRIIQKSNGTLKRLRLWKRDLTALPSKDFTAPVLFEGEFYLKSRIETFKETIELFVVKHNPKSRSGAVTE